ncbi:hypothetical protein V7x_25290 [Crateriforma conspicua]|uniref:Uncharacterized protein n=1 Tax=Crateriforma conspicua TaxID=2527996 RepID=A0A5C6FVD3_9PLAN|nr:hypothetical protein V7x_25290 [Crateriforma conspicua]
MMLSLLKALLCMAAILGLWLSIQKLWCLCENKPAQHDALQGRTGCKGCGGGRCKNHPTSSNSVRSSTKGMQRCS